MDIYDGFGNQTETIGGDYKELDAYSETLALRIVEQRKKDGASEPGLVPVALVKNPKEIRWFNLRYRMTARGRQWEHPGAIAFALQILNGKWRVATAEELAAEMAAQDKVREAQRTTQLSSLTGAQRDALAKALA